MMAFFDHLFRKRDTPQGEDIGGSHGSQSGGSQIGAAQLGQEDLLKYYGKNTGFDFLVRTIEGGDLLKVPTT